ncbi:hypothetical protein DFH09DRAFT_1390601 [Mycena vulgaris]|nr:hypothetical protein DFH09DRAFT_1390601 [Mycena vulgaris]
MDPESAAPPGFRIVELSGPLLLGNLLHWGLFGTLSVQLYLYYQAFPDDRWSTKCAFIGQSFYAYRVYVLSKSWLIPTLIVVVSMTSSVGGFITGAFTLKAGNLGLLNDQKNAITTGGVWCGASALSDIIIAVCMTYYVSFMRILVSKLIRLTIETGSLTALAALATLSLSLAFPNRNYYLTPAALLPKLYANCILVVLNARIQIVGGRGTYTSSTDVISAPIYFQNSEPDRGVSNPDSRPSHVVTINREVFSDGDVHDHVEMKVMAASELGPCV